MKTKMLIANFLLGVMTLTAVAQTNSTDYFGQTPPGDTAVVFAPGIISLNDRSEHKIVFSPDWNECYYITSKGLYFRKRVNNLWSEPEKFSFKTDSNLNADDVSISLDGKRIYFNCFNDEFTFSDIWVIERTKRGWSDPQILPYPFNTSSKEFGYSESDDGYIYFSSNRPGTFGALDIWRTKRLADQSYYIENLGPNVNSSRDDFTPCIARDGSYLIFASSRRKQALYICFNKGNNEWTKAINMNSAGAKINYVRYAERYPTLSPDENYLFFNHHGFNSTKDSTDVYWVRTHVIVGLKKFAFAPKLTKQIPDIDIKAGTVLNYVIPDSTFSCEYGDETLKYTAALSNGSALPKWLHFNPATKTLSGKPKTLGTSIIKITASNAYAVSDSCVFKISLKDNN